VKFFSASRLITWIVLIAIPFFAMGRAAGHVGLVLDDWYVWRAIAEGRWFGADGARPLGYLPMALAYSFAHNNMALLLVFNILAHGVAAILLYELGYILLSKSLPRSGRFLAAAAAAIFVIYPSDVSRFFATASIGTRFVTIEMLAAAIIWALAIQYQRPRIVAFAFIPVVIDLLRVESAVAVLALIPLLTLVRGFRPWSRPWIIPTALWEAALGAYLVWHFAFAKFQWAFGRFHGAAVDVRPIELVSPLAMIGLFMASLKSITIETVTLGFSRLSEALQTGNENVGLPISAAGFGIAVALFLWLANRDTKAPAEVALSMTPRRWLWLVLWALLITFAGLLPYLVNGAHYTVERTPPQTILSRYTAIAAIGVSILLIIAALLPIYVPLRRLEGGESKVARFAPVLNLLAVGAVCAFAVALGVIRLVQTGHQYEASWKQKQDVFRAVVQQNGLWQKGTLIVLHDFPASVDGSLFEPSWAYRSALGLFLDPPPSDLPLTNDPSDLWIYPDNSGETMDWSVSGKTLSVKWFELRDRVTFPLERVVALGYDPATKLISALDTFPREDLPPGSHDVHLYTGINQPEPVRQIKSVATEILSPWNQDASCSAEIAVRSSDLATHEGTVSAFTLPSGRLLDRRYVRAHSALHYNFDAPCGSRGVLRFDRGPWRFVDALEVGDDEEQQGAWRAPADGATSELNVRLGDLKSAAH
jgi:hypothetical protein